jgi:hypothetical protein
MQSYDKDREKQNKKVKNSLLFAHLIVSLPQNYFENHDEYT